MLITGSQVIEQERQRVLALKQRVQEEVRNKWAQRAQDYDPIVEDDTRQSRCVFHIITSINLVR